MWYANAIAVAVWSLIVLYDHRTLLHQPRDCQLDRAECEEHILVFRRSTVLSDMRSLYRQHMDQRYQP